MPYLGYDRGSHANNYHSHINFIASAEEKKEASEYGEDHFRGFNATTNRRLPRFIGQRIQAIDNFSATRTSEGTP
jgi:hypothetical protein